MGTAQAIFLGIVTGVLLGWLMGPISACLRPLGDIFISLLKLIIVPLIFSSIVVGVHRTGSMARLGKIGGRTLLYYLITTGLAMLLGLILVNLIRPGVGVHLSHEAAPPASHAGSFQGFLGRLIPQNIFQAFAEMNILPIIVFAVMFGIALLTANRSAKPLVDLMRSTEEVFLVFTRGVMAYAPIGVIGLIAPLVGTFGFDIFLSFDKFILVVLGGLLIHACVVLPLVMKLFSNRSVTAYARSLQKPFLTAFATASSSATLPISMEAARENGISDETASFVLPLGATINMDGTALYEAVVAVFIAQAVDMPLTLGQQGIVFITAMLASIGAAGIPSAGLFTLLLVLEAVGLPAVGLGILFAIDRPLDMCRTTVNVWGDQVGCAVVEGKNNHGK